MRIAGIIEESIVDGPGVRVVIFFQGCAHHCDGCHNPETWDPALGVEKELDFIDDLLARCPYADGLTLSGGDPLFQVNGALSIAKLAKDKYHLHVLCYTGEIFEDLVKKSEDDPELKELLTYLDTVIDGPYIKSRRDLALIYRGSSNQRAISVPASLAAGHICLEHYN